MGIGRTRTPRERDWWQLSNSLGKEEGLKEDERVQVLLNVCDGPEAHCPGESWHVSVRQAGGLLIDGSHTGAVPSEADTDFNSSRELHCPDLGRR